MCDAEPRMCMMKSFFTFVLLIYPQTLVGGILKKTFLVPIIVIKDLNNE